MSEHANFPDNARKADIDEVYRRLRKYHGIRKHVASNRLHQIKGHHGIGADELLLFDLTGNVFDPVTHEWLGSMTEGGK